MACRKGNCISQRILIAAILITILVIMMVFQKNRENPPIKKMYRYITDSITVSNIDSVVISQKLKNRTLKFVKKNNQWILVNKNFNVNKVEWQDFLNNLKKLRLEEMVSVQKSKFKDFELDSIHRTTLICYSNKKEIYYFNLGKNGIGSSSIYFKSKKDNKVFLCSGIPKYTISRSADMWIEKNIYNNIVDTNIISLKYNMVDSNCNIEINKLSDNPRNYSIIYNTKKLDSIPTTKINSLFSKIRKIRISDVYVNVNDKIKKEIENSQNYLTVKLNNDSLSLKFINNVLDPNNVSYLVYDNKLKKYFNISKYLLNSIAKESKKITK